jgi:protein-disulfide isomerase
VVKSSARQGSNRAFYLIIGLVAVAGIGALTYASSKKPETVTQVDTTLPPVKSEGYVLGSETAPVEVIEFGDFECTVCATFATLTEPDMRKRLVNTGIVRMRYIDYPLPMHPNTWNASRAAACADEQGKFWDMHDALFQNQDRWSRAGGNTNPDKFFKELAKQIPIPNSDQFNTCVDSRKYQAKIQAHEKLGEQQKAGGTPTFVIGKQMYLKPLPYDEFKALVDSELKASGKPLPAVGGDSARGVTLQKKK